MMTVRDNMATTKRYCANKWVRSRKQPIAFCGLSKGALHKVEVTITQTLNSEIFEVVTEEASLAASSSLKLSAPINALPL